MMRDQCVEYAVAPDWISRSGLYCVTKAARIKVNIDYSGGC